MKVLLLLLLAAPAALCFNCVGVADGVYEAGCKYFIKCIYGVATTVECDGDQVYNQLGWQHAACVDPSTVGAPCGLQRDCSNLDDRHYADLLTNCTSYYTCHGHTYFGHNYCGGGLVFNDHLQLCDWPDPSNPCSKSSLIG